MSARKFKLLFLCALILGAVFALSFCSRAKTSFSVSGSIFGGSTTLETVVELFESATYGGSAKYSTTTSTGSYLFPSVAIGTYYLRAWQDSDSDRTLVFGSDYYGTGFSAVAISDGDLFRQNVTLSLQTYVITVEVDRNPGKYDNKNLSAHLIRGSNLSLSEVITTQSTLLASSITTKTFNFTVSNGTYLVYVLQQGPSLTNRDSVLSFIAGDYSSRETVVVSSEGKSISVVLQPYRGSQYTLSGNTNRGGGPIYYADSGALIPVGTVESNGNINIASNLHTGAFFAIFFIGSSGGIFIYDGNGNGTLEASSDYLTIGNTTFNNSFLPWSP